MDLDMAPRGVLGGVRPDPDKGKSFRQVRAKARLMKGTLTGTQLQVALELLIEKRPEDALDAMISASGEQ
jgi:hypothetical protein